MLLASRLPGGAGGLRVARRRGQQLRPLRGDLRLGGLPALAPAGPAARTAAARRCAPPAASAPTPGGGCRPPPGAAPPPRPGGRRRRRAPGPPARPGAAARRPGWPAPGPPPGSSAGGRYACHATCCSIASAGCVLHQVLGDPPGHPLRKQERRASSSPAPVGVWSGRSVGASGARWLVGDRWGVGGMMLSLCLSWTCLLCGQKSCPPPWWSFLPTPLGNFLYHGGHRGAGGGGSGCVGDVDGGVAGVAGEAQGVDGRLVPLLRGAAARRPQDALGLEAAQGAQQRRLAQPDAAVEHPPVAGGDAVRASATG